MIELIYENKDWLPFFKDALDEIDAEYRLNKIDEFELDLNQPPDNILYINRISPSSHTRGHNIAYINGEQYLEYLASYNRTVINDYRTINYELSKVEQIKLLKRHGLSYPQTVFGSDIIELIKAAAQMPLPFLTKHNCSGKGLGIQRRTANQSSVHILLTHQGVNIVRNDRATIQYSYLASNIFFVHCRH